MRRRLLAVLLISGVLLVAVIPLMNLLFNPTAGVVSSSDNILPMYVLRDVDRDRGEVGLNFVPGELITKFKMDATEKEIYGLEVGLGAQEVYVSPFTQARRWRVPPSKTVEERAVFFCITF